MASQYGHDRDFEPFIAGLCALAMLNGFYSPLLLLVLNFWPLWYPSLIPPNGPLIYYLSSVLTATLVLMFGGVPAALYERLRGGGITDRTALWIWLMAVVILSLPALRAFLSPIAGSA